MKICDAMAMLDKFQPNSFDVGDKIAWLEELDKELWQEVVQTHEGGEDVPEPCYSAGEQEQALLVDGPYKCIYLHWLQSKLDYALGDFARFNNSYASFEADRAAWKNWYHRNHMPLQNAKGVYF